MLFFLVPAIALAEPGLTLLHADGGAISRTVSETGSTVLIFHLESSGETEYELDLGDFVSERDQQVEVTIGKRGAPATGRLARLRFEDGEHRKEMQLLAADLVPGVEYRGTLTASTQGQSPILWKVTLRKPVAMAELTADIARAELQLELWPLLDQHETAAFNVLLREKSGTLAIEGITVRRAPGSEIHGNFDIKENLRFALDGKPIDDLTSWPAAGNLKLRRIAAGEQRTLRIQVHGLTRGEHKLTLLLEAANASNTSPPKLEINVRVRHARWAPAFALLLAILVSYLITKGIVNWRQRKELSDLAQSCARDWPDEVRELAPVVWLKATRRQALMVLERFALLPAPEDLTARLTAARRILRVMERYVEVRENVDLNVSTESRYMLHFRMRDALDRTIAEIDPRQLDEVKEKEFIAKLDRIDGAVEDPVLLYRPYVASAQKKTPGRGLLDMLPTRGRATPKKLNALWESYVMRPVREDAGLEELLAIDRACAAFRVLKRHVEFGDEEVLERLVALIAKDDVNQIDSKQVFSITNESMWAKIKAAVSAHEVTISPSQHAPRAMTAKALVPMQFSVEIDDATLNDTFMAKRRMVADWAFELRAETARSKPICWRTRATGKKLLQFAPAAGTLSTSVTLSYGADSSSPIEGSVNVGRPRGGMTSALFAVQEIVLVAVAAVIAFASGLVMFYEANPSFGSIQDYLALFTWGVGVEQGKNLAQTFTGLSKQTRG